MHIAHCPLFLWLFIYILYIVFHWRSLQYMNRFLENSHMSYAIKGLMTIRWTRLIHHMNMNDEKCVRPKIIQRNYSIPNRLKTKTFKRRYWCSNLVLIERLSRMLESIKSHYFIRAHSNSRTKSIKFRIFHGF